MILPDQHSKDQEVKASDEGMRWFVRVRWAAVLAEVLVVGAATALDEVLPLVPMGALIAGQAISNAVMQPHPPTTQAGRTLILTLDVAVLFALLALSGGPSNPFSALFFVQVTLAAVLLPRTATAFVWASAVVAYGALFAIRPATHHHGGGDFAVHLYGMFAAFALTSGLIAYFVHRLSVALRKTRLREAHARRVASLTTFAAGAAHELGTPLGTIALIASELSDQVDDAHREDLEVIRQQTARCRQILDSIHHKAGGVAGEGLSELSFEELADEIRIRIGPDRAARLDVSGEGDFEGPKLAFLQVLENLVTNAFDASDQESRVSLSFDAGSLRVRDRGTGMDAETLARVTEPYFTTKPEGQGTGLGLFVAAETISAVGGTLELESTPNQGTTVTVHLPGAA